MDRIERLLGNGYFPSQLPPPFTTRRLASNHAALYTDWVALQTSTTRGPKVPRAPSSKPELFSVARAGHQRRITSLPNPVAQTYLATQVAQHWGQIVRHYRQSRLSASHGRFLAASNRAVTIPSMQLLYERKLLQSAGYKFMLRSDISRFFPTIYTHSVPWAVHGKGVAKKKRKELTPRYFGNLLDLAIRQGQDEQTIGLPIGPDTSHIIAEAIATSIDVELKKRLKGWPAGFRYVDDYYFFFATHTQAETALAALSRSLKDFELQINFEKTTICSIQELTDDYWTHQLRSFEIATNGRKQRSDLNHFFELAKDLVKLNSDESVMKYALKRTESTVIRKENWDCFEAHICHVALGFPNTLQTVARLLSTYSGVGYPIGTARLERLINALIQEHGPLEHHSEVAWCLWMCKDIGIKLTDHSVDLVAEMHSSVCALLLLDLSAMGKLPKAPRVNAWKDVETSDALHSELWLLAYEAGIRHWGGFTDSHIKSDPHFALLLAKGVHFYDANASLAPLFQVKPEARAQRIDLALSAFFDLEDVDELLDFEDGDEGYEGVVVVEEIVADDEPYA